MQQNIVSARLSLITRLIAFLVASPMLLFVGGYTLVAALTTGKPWPLLLLPCFLIVFGILISWAELRFCLLVSDRFVEQTYWRTVRIYYDEMTELEVLKINLVLKGGGKKIKIPSGVKDRDSVSRLILRRAGKSPGINITGDTERLRLLQAQSR